MCHIITARKKDEHFLLKHLVNKQRRELSLENHFRKGFIYQLAFKYNMHTRLREYNIHGVSVVGMLSRTVTDAMSVGSTLLHFNQGRIYSPPPRKVGRKI